MCDRRALSMHLDRIKAHWQNLPTSNAAFDGYYELAHGYTDKEVDAAVTLLLREYDQAAHPKPATLAQYLRRVSSRQNGETFGMEEGVFCPVCGTRELVNIPAPAVDTSLWDKIKKAFWQAIGLINDQQPYLVLPDRMHPRCLPSCSRWTS